MPQITRRVLLAAAVAVPAAVVAEQVADAAAEPLVPRQAPGAPDLAGGPVATLDPVVDPAGEIGGLQSASEQAVGELSPGRAAAPAPTSQVGQGTATRLGAATTAVEPAAVPFTFRATAFDVHDLGVAGRPYSLATPVPLKDSGVHDRTGVRMKLWRGKLYDHPVAQAQYGITLHESYRLTRKKAYLDKAILQAERIVARRTVRGKAWFYPYKYAFPLHNGRDVLPAPWYSMMAQGMALSLFTRLAETTKQARWRAAADLTFASFLLPYAAGKPWGVYVKDRLLRFEEYPHPRKLWGDLTYNGHVYAVFGLYDYWTLTENKTCLALLRGGMTTARDLIPSLRVRNFRSHYCLRHRHDSGHYHSIHIAQLQKLQAITHDQAFARHADLLYADYPPVGLGARGGWKGGSVVFAKGRHAAYRFAPDGTVLESRVVTFKARTLAPATDRARIRGRAGYWLAISRGMLAGWWVQEAPSQRFLAGTHAILVYPVPRTARMDANQPLAVTVSARGTVTSVRTAYKKGDEISVNARASLNGVEHLRLASGPQAQRWVRASIVSGL